MCATRHLFKNSNFTLCQKFHFYFFTLSVLTFYINAQMIRCANTIQRIHGTSIPAPIYRRNENCIYILGWAVLPIHAMIRCTIIECSFSVRCNCSMRALYGKRTRLLLAYLYRGEMKTKFYSKAANCMFKRKKAC